MGDQDPMQRRLESSRPSLGFPLGTALLLILIFCITGFFSCCYHWDKLRSLRRTTSASAGTDDIATSSDPLPSSKPTTPDQSSKQNQNQSLPVLMPGDEIPKFIAWPHPHQPPPPTRMN